MAKLHARGRKQLFTMHGSFLAENREAQYAFMDDHKVLKRSRTFGYDWSHWTVLKTLSTWEQLEERLLALGYVKRITQ